MIGLYIGQRLWHRSVKLVYVFGDLAVIFNEEVNLLSFWIPRMNSAENGVHIWQESKKIRLKLFDRSRRGR